jgi:hypothetical protein
VIGAEEDELACRSFYARLVEHRFQWNAGPSPVARQPLERTAVARALEAENQLCALHLLEIVERQRQRLVDEPRDLQPEFRRIDVGVTVVLRREELVARSERTSDVTNVDDPAVGRRRRVDTCRRQVGEGHERLALRESGNRPFWNAQDAKSGHGETSLEDLPTGALFRHVRPSRKTSRFRVTYHALFVRRSPLVSEPARRLDPR